MLKLENTEVLGWEHAIRGMRNPMNSWEKSDSEFTAFDLTDEHRSHDEFIRYLRGEDLWRAFSVGPNDLDLMTRLRNAGTDHRKFMRMITVYVDLTAPLYWWKEFDTYKVGTVANSCSTMHKIAAKEFTLKDFSCEHLTVLSKERLKETIGLMNLYRDLYVNWDKRDDNTKNGLLHDVFDGEQYQKKDAWWQMIQLLPSSYNQRRTVMLNYEVLANIYKSRRNHRLDEWHTFCDWIERLPYSELITGKGDHNE